MFFPKFEITNRLLQSLIKIEVDLNIIKNIEVPIEWQLRLKKENQIKRLVSTLRFVGSDVGSDLVGKVLADEPGRDERVASLAESLGIVAKESDLQEVVNWIYSQRLVDQMVYLSTKFRQNDLGEKDLIQLNKLFGERLVKVEDLGVWRKDNFVENSSLNHPKLHEMLYQLDDLLNWNRTTPKEVLHPVLKSTILFYELLRIRPFLQNNLQTATLFFVLSLGVGEFETSYVAIEEELFKNKQKFFEVISVVDEYGKGLTEMLEMVVGNLAVAYEKAKVRLLSVSGESVKYKTEAGRAVALSERQVALMEELTVKDQLTIKELRQVLPLVSDDTILRDLKDLVVKKMIRKKGKTKGAVYVLGKVKSFR